jgi:hypothetical protein
MIKQNLLLSVLIVFSLTGYLLAEPGFNGTSPGCTGSGCHTFQDNIVSVVPLNNLQIQITLTGNTGNVGGELVNSGGTVVAFINSTSSNPFILTAPFEGTYLINAGYKNPSKRWDSTHVTIQIPPSAPSNLVGQMIQNPLSVQLSWTDNSNNENGFIIERENLGPDAFIVIDTVGANQNTYTDLNVAYMTYAYRIAAFNASGQSAYSNVSQVIVPVELISFTTILDESGVLLKWTTGSETNNMGFDILRSIDNDNNNWQTIGFIEGRGTSTELTNYEFYNELSEFNSIVNLRYKLKQVDYNGAFSYSDIVEVEFTPGTFFLTQNYPNPFNPTTKIKFAVAKDGLVILKVFNALGKEVKTLVNKNLTAGQYDIYFDGSELTSGVYIYQLNAENKTFSKKMMLLK